MKDDAVKSRKIAVKSRFTLYDEEFEELMDRSNFMERSDRGLVEQTYELQGKGITGQYRIINLPQLQLVWTTQVLPFDLVMPCRIGPEMVQMHFGLTGYQYSPLDGQKMAVAANQHNLFYLRGNLDDRVDSARCLDYHTFEVNMEPAYLNRLLPHHPDLIPHFSAGLQQGASRLLGGQARPITPAMRQIVSAMEHCRLPGVLQQSYLEAKVQELLILQIAQFMDQPLPSMRLQAADQAKLYGVKEWIDAHAHESITLGQLASLSGLNTDKLGKGFKALFGTTIFTYLTGVRLEEARQLILSGGLSIGQISVQAGYKNPQHFTAAFKRKFGYLPSELRS